MVLSCVPRKVKANRRQWYQKTNGTDGGLTQSLGYDALNRLTAVTSGAENESYQYDADGNRTYQVVNGQATNFAYASSSNELTSMASPGANATMFGYNADGDTTTIYGHAAYTYGPFERLTNVGGTSYVISAEGQRLRKSTGGNVTYFTPGPSGTLLAEDDNNNWMDYVWLNGRPAIVIVNGGVFPIHGDQTGRPLYVSHPNTHAMIWAAQGLPFTRNIATNNFWTFNLGFPGQYLDAESGLWHNGNRDYDSQTGRYIESDPAELAGGANTYAYVGNNPISDVDPLGLCPTCSQLQQQAAQLAGALDHTSHVAAAIAFSGALAAGIAGFFEPETFGLDTPVTATGAATTDYFAAAAFVTGAGGAALNSFANGNTSALGRFDFNSIAEIGMKITASDIPLVSGFSENLGLLTGKALEIAEDAKAACQSP